METRSEGGTPYVIPAGGSNQIGAWGYIEAFRELMDQVQIYNYRSTNNCMYNYKYFCLLISQIGIFSPVKYFACKIFT